MDNHGVSSRDSQLMRERAQVPLPSNPHADSLIPDLTVVVPTLNERGNLEPLLAGIASALESRSWEVIFVDDDSSDGTADHARSLSRRDPRVRCLQRIGRRGLSTACVEGALASAAPYIAVMDGDLQHDERLLPHMLDVLQREPIDVVIGSRYISGGEAGGGLSASRARVSTFATWLARFICKAEIADPMSGFFMLRRDVFDGAVRNLSGQGFKILLDLLASSPRPLRIRELAYEFRQRRFGESKLDVLVAWEYGVLLVDKLIGHIVPVRFAMFVMIGGLGLIAHLGVLWTGITLGLRFTAAQTAATIVAMTSNFLLNNLFTYHDKRLRGWRLLRGLLSFYLICVIGAVANVGIANYVFRLDRAWWVAGIAGAVVGSVWNFAVSSSFTWGKR
jgi:dolichol-phosphate mannosyltransferase